MTTTLETTEDRARVSFRGRFGVSSAAQAIERLIEAISTGHPVDIDLSELTEADASLLQILLSARQSAQAGRIEISVSKHGYAIVTLLERHGLESLLAEPFFEGGEEVQYFFFDEEAL